MAARERNHLSLRPEYSQPSGATCLQELALRFEVMFPASGVFGIAFRLGRLCSDISFCAMQSSELSLAVCTAILHRETVSLLFWLIVF